MKCLWAGSDKSTDPALYPAERERETARGGCEGHQHGKWGESWHDWECFAWYVYKMPEKPVRKASSQSPLLYTLSHVSLSPSVSLSWQEPWAEDWLMPVCGSSERTKEPAHSRERSRLAKMSPLILKNEGTSVWQNWRCSFSTPANEIAHTQRL